MEKLGYIGCLFYMVLQVIHTSEMGPSVGNPALDGAIRRNSAKVDFQLRRRPLGQPDREALSWGHAGGFAKGRRSPVCHEFFGEDEVYQNVLTWG